MKKIVSLFAVLTLLFATNTARADLGFGFIVGLATPNEYINDIYNADKVFEKNDNPLDHISDATKFGYQIGVKVRLPMSENAAFIGGIGVTRFPETDITVTDPKTNDTLLVLGTNQNVIPISAGINYYLFNSGIGIYGTGELTYNLITNSVDYKSGDVNIPIANGPTDSRVGFGIGAGIDFNLPGLFAVNLEGRYNFTNLIGRVDDENIKTYATLTLGIYFGGKYEED